MRLPPPTAVGVARYELLCSGFWVKAFVETLCHRAENFCPEANRPWLIERYRRILSSAEGELGMLFAAAGRRVGLLSTDVALGSVDTTRWKAADLARVAGLLLALEGRQRDDHLGLLEDLYFRGSATEKRAVLLALPLTPFPADSLSLAVEACRTNTVEVFDAIACENSFPANYFEELQFNQLVLKTIFLDLEVRRIVGVRARITPTLIENLFDFKAEREAAGRSVPDGLTWLLAPQQGKQ